MALDDPQDLPPGLIEALHRGDPIDAESRAALIRLLGLRRETDDPAPPLEPVASTDGSTATLTAGSNGEVVPPTTEPSTTAYSGREAAESPPQSVGPSAAVGPGARYRLIKTIGHGGLGVVHLARDAEMARDVALKEIRPDQAFEPDRRARFLREAGITARLEHPGIVPVYGMGAFPDGRPFYAMRYIQGESLWDAIARLHEEGGPRRGSLELRKLLGSFIDACLAVDYAHARGVVHRDLKPANIMLGPFGETQVLDWGLAKAPDHPEPAGWAGSPPTPGVGDDALTRDGDALGTPAFMSPEQASRRVDLVGPASDVYGLGATLYAILTGRRPFPQDLPFPILALRILAGDFPRPRQVCPGVPRALEFVCLKAMSPRPEDRHPSARALADDVERWLADLKGSGFRPGVHSR